MNKTNQKNRLYFFFSLIFTLLITACGVRNYKGFVEEDARFANYTALGNDSAGLAYYADESNPNEIAVAIGTCTASTITINKYENKPVTQVFPAGFQNCKTATSINLPDSVTVFGTDAFAGSSIQSIRIPKNLRVISTGAFRNCRSLATVEFPENNQVNTISDYAFANDYNLSSFPFRAIKNLTTIGREAFLYCLGLRNIVFPESFTTLESYAFQDCKYLNTVYFPDSITTIGSYCFKGVGEQAKIYFSEKRETTIDETNLIDLDSEQPFKDEHNLSYGDYYVPIYWGVGSLIFDENYPNFQFTHPKEGSYPLLKYTSDANGNWGTDETVEHEEPIADDEVILMSLEVGVNPVNVNIPATIEWGGETLKVVGIKSDVFAGKTSIKSVTFHENLRFIDAGAFSGCKNLVSMNLQDAVDLNHIQSRAFYNTLPNSSKRDIDHMYSIHIPSSVQNIGADAFRSCTGLFKIFFDGASDDYEETFITDGKSASFELAYVPNVSSISVVSDGVPVSSSGYSLSGKTLTLTSKPSSARVVRVKYTTNSTTTKTFKGHKDNDGEGNMVLVKDFILPYKAEAIGSITVGGIAETHYTTSDYDDGKKTKITFENGHIPAEDSTIVVSYKAKSQLKRIDEFAFYGCSDNLAKESFYSRTLYKYDNPFQKVYFPESLESIGTYAFGKTQIVGSAIFKSSSLEIGERAFFSVESLSSIVFPDEMDDLTLNAGAFYSDTGVADYCAADRYKKLISVTLPENTTVTGDSIFNGHFFLAIYCIGSEPSGSDSFPAWRKLGGTVLNTFGDFSGSAIKDELDYAPVYTVESASDIVTLPSDDYPVFDFVKTDDDFAVLTRYHYYGGRIKDQDGDSAIKQGEDVSIDSLDNLNNDANNQRKYDSQYAVLLSNGHMRLEVPASVQFGNEFVPVKRIGDSALAVQINTNSKHPKYEADTSKYAQLIENDASDGIKYWKEAYNFYTMREIYLPDTLEEIGSAAMVIVPFTTVSSYDAENATVLSEDGLSMIYDHSSGDIPANGSKDGLFPKNLKKIEKKSFAFSSITSARLPSCLNTFGTITSTVAPVLDKAYFYFPFMGCFDLGVLSIYEVTQSNPAVFKASGGVISYAEQNLMIEGAGGKTSVEIPWRTKHTVAGAIRGGRNILNVHFPYTLEEVSNNFLDAIGTERDAQGRSGISSLQSVSFESGNYSAYASDSVTDTEKQTINSSKCETIGKSAFYGCNSLVNLELPKGLKSLGETTFHSCSSLNNISVDNGNSDTSPYADLPNTGMGAHLNCNNLPSLSSIGKGCFTKCSALEGLTTAYNLKSLSESAFIDCTGLTSLTLDSETKTLGGSCFSGCTSLPSATFNASKSSLGTSCFSGCTSLASITFNGSDSNTIGSSCFNNCTSLTSVTFATGAWATFSDSSFSGCTSLADIKIPSNSKLNKTVFLNCSALSDVTVETNVTFGYGKDNSAFIGCPSSTRIFLKDTESSYLNARGTRYPEAWNYSSYENNHGDDLDFYVYCDTDPGVSNSNYGFWTENETTHLPEIVRERLP